MDNFKIERFLSRRFFGFNQKLSDDSTHPGLVLDLINFIQTSRNLNIIGEEIFYFHSKNEWIGPFFEVNGYENVTNEMVFFNFRDFNDFCLPINTEQVPEFSFGHASKQIARLEESLPRGPQVVGTLLSCDIAKIELHFFVQ